MKIMNKILLTVGAITVLGTAGVSAENWQYITEDRDEKVYIDTDNIERKGQHVDVWVKTVERNGSYDVDLIRFYPGKRYTATLEEKEYSPLGVLKKHEREYYDRDLDDIDRGSEEEKIYEYLMK